ncbi:hypothetical protein LTR60_005018, partial [Cryomyces antarcticus]
MDSMRSLNKSLPRASSSKQPVSQTPEQLLQAFKTAALSVTNLYKTAASDQTRARSAGYQEALDDLLVFLDRENLGLGDGEGWKVRQWATERLDGSIPGHVASDSDEEVEEEKRARSSSPVIQRKGSSDTSTSIPVPEATSPARTGSAPPTVTAGPEMFAAPEPPVLSVPQASSFTFRSSHSYPTGHDIEIEPTDYASPSTATTTPSLRLDTLPRHSRNSRHNAHLSRINNRPSSNLGSGAGAKRKTPFGDFFDI